MDIEVHQGDITRLKVDVIVNAANNGLVGGGGVDGAIHRAAGPELSVACRRLGGCPTGEVRETDGYQLSAKKIFHTVGPVWQGGLSGEPQLLSDCYRKCLELAVQMQCKSIAFPAISCGVYGYPTEKSVAVVIRTLRAFELDCPEDLHVVLCCFDEGMAEMYRKALEAGMN